MAYDFVANYVPQEYDQDEFTYGELLEREKNIIGLNIKYNFLNQYQELYTKYNLMHISDVRENMNVKVLGYIQSIKQVKTKNNETQDNNPCRNQHSGNIFLQKGRDSGLS